MKHVALDPHDLVPEAVDRKIKRPPKDKTVQILALDLATKTGWALRDDHGKLTSGVRDFSPKRGEDIGLRFLKLRVWVRHLLNELDNGIVVYEQSLAVQRGGHAAALIHGFVAEVQAEVANTRGRVAHLACVHPSTLKKHATGSGKAGKPEMVMAAKTKWPQQKIKDDNQADALWVLDWARKEFDL